MGAFPIDTLIVNEHECRDCCGVSPEAVVSLSAADRGQLLTGRGINHLVITRGAASTLHVTAAEVIEVPTLALVPVDTVGAGDTFAGVLAAELATGREWQLALRHANAAAGLSTLVLGAQAAMPTRAQVEAALRLT